MRTAKNTKKATRSTQADGNGKKRRWVASVKTDSTHPPAGLFTRTATAIARSLASSSVSPKGTASGMRMLNYFINRAGKGLSRRRRQNWNARKCYFQKESNTQKVRARGLRKAARYEFGLERGILHFTSRPV